MTAPTQSNPNNEQPILPGRLAGPNKVLKTDPRADPRLVTALAPLQSQNGSLVNRV